MNKHTLSGVYIFEDRHFLYSLEKIYFKNLLEYDGDYVWGVIINGNLPKIKFKYMFNCIYLYSRGVHLYSVIKS